MGIYVNAVTLRRSQSRTGGLPSGSVARNKGGAPFNSAVGRNTVGAGEPHNSSQPPVIQRQLCGDDNESEIGETLFRSFPPVATPPQPIECYPLQPRTGDDRIARNSENTPEFYQ